MSTQAQDAGPARTTPHRALAIEARDLVKTYPKGIRALDGLSFTVQEGTVFGLLGPNGAGKSTTVKILTTLAQADSGSASVAGLDVRTRAAAVRRAIGVVAQRSGADPTATGRENLLLSGRIQGLRGRELGRRAGRAAGPVRPGRRRGPDGPDLLGRHAAPARRGHGADPPAGGAVPRRAHRGPGPGVALGDVGRDRPAVRRRGPHDPADHALPGGGRPAGQPAGHRRTRHRGRGGQPGRAEGPAARRLRARRAGRPWRPRATGPASCARSRRCATSA